MDIAHDWKTLNEVFFPKDVLGASQDGRSSIVVIEENGRITDGVASNGALFSENCDFEKSKLDALSAKYCVDQAIVISKKSFDQNVADVANLGTNYFQQLETLRKKLLEEVGPLIVPRKHFLLDLFSSRFRKMLPRRFNFLLFVDHRPGYSETAPSRYQAILCSYSDGKLDQFFEPDFSSLHEERLRNWKTENNAIGQYLESRYILPCIGIFLGKEEWESCLRESVSGPAISAENNKRKPTRTGWRSFLKFYDDNRIALYPHKNFPLKAWLATRRVVVYFTKK